MNRKPLRHVVSLLIMHPVSSQWVGLVLRCPVLRSPSTKNGQRTTNIVESLHGLEIPPHHHPPRSRAARGQGRQRHHHGPHHRSCSARHCHHRRQAALRRRRHRLHLRAPHSLRQPETLRPLRGRLPPGDLRRRARKKRPGHLRHPRQRRQHPLHRTRHPQPHAAHERHCHAHQRVRARRRPRKLQSQVQNQNRHQNSRHAQNHPRPAHAG